MFTYLFIKHIKWTQGLFTGEDLAENVRLCLLLIVASLIANLLDALIHLFCSCSRRGAPPTSVASSRGKKATHKTAAKTLNDGGETGGGEKGIEMEDKHVPATAGE